MPGISRSKRWSVDIVLESIRSRTSKVTARIGQRPTASQTPYRVKEFHAASTTRQDLLSTLHKQVSHMFPPLYGWEWFTAGVCSHAPGQPPMRARWWEQS